MGILQRLSFPGTMESFGLYFKSDGRFIIEEKDGEKALLLDAGTSASTNTYFNTFYQQHYAGTCKLGPLAWQMDLRGHASIQLKREGLNNTKEILSETEFNLSGPAATVSIPIPESDSGRVFIEVHAIGPVSVTGGRIVNSEVEQPVHLAVIITCFQRETFVGKNVSTLLSDPELIGNLDIYVVDNGGTLNSEMFKNEQVHIVPNDNTGGAGGFSRGMLEALSGGKSTHMLLMDDDIEVPSESVFRTLAFFRHTTQKVAVSGSMFDHEKPHVLHEAGARWGWGTDVPKLQPLKIYPLKHNLYMQSSLCLNALLLDEPVDYGAFWFFAFPMEMPKEHGFCLPFFVVGDDIEFGLRFNRAFGGRIVPLAGVAVWHMPFYFKLESLSSYFFFRNLLAVSAIYDEYAPIVVALRTLRELLKKIFTFDYLLAYKQIRGIEDFLCGPDMNHETDISKLQSDVDAFARDHDIVHSLVGPDLSDAVFESKGMCSVPIFLLNCLTVGGHLLPWRIIKNNPALIITHRDDQWKKVFGHGRVHSLHQESRICREFLMNKKLGLVLFFRAVKLSVRMFLSWRTMRAQWKKKARFYTSENYWAKRAGGKSRMP